MSISAGMYASGIFAAINAMVANNSVMFMVFTVSSLFRILLFSFLGAMVRGSSLNANFVIRLKVFPKYAVGCPLARLDGTHFLFHRIDIPMYAAMMSPNITASPVK